MTERATFTDDLILCGRALVAISDAVRQLKPAQHDIGEPLCDLLARLTDQTDFLAGIVQGLVTATGYANSVRYPDYDAQALVEPVQFMATSVGPVAGRGLVAVGPYPFDASPSSVRGRPVRIGNDTYSVRGVEWQGARPYRGLTVSLLLSPMAPPAARDVFAPGQCDLCADQCRGHRLGHPEEWEPEPGSRASLAAMMSPFINEPGNLVPLTEPERAFLRWVTYFHFEAQDGTPPSLPTEEGADDMLRRLGRPDDGDQFENEDMRQRRNQRLERSDR